MVRAAKWHTRFYVLWASLIASNLVAALAIWFLILRFGERFVLQVRSIEFELSYTTLGILVVFAVLLLNTICWLGVWKFSKGVIDKRAFLIVLFMPLGIYASMCLTMLSMLVFMLLHHSFSAGT